MAAPVRASLALCAVAALMLSAAPATARPAPAGFAELAAKLLPSVVNISTTQTIKKREGGSRGPEVPRFPPGSPFEEFFKDFFDRQQRREGPQRRATSLGSGLAACTPEFGRIPALNAIARARTKTFLFLVISHSSFFERCLYRDENPILGPAATSG